jgi:hypothetical protein
MADLEKGNSHKVLPTARFGLLAFGNKKITSLSTKLRRHLGRGLGIEQ